MSELCERWRAVLNAVHRGPCAWSTPSEVADALGWDVERTSDELASMDVEGWLEVWEQDDGPVVTLSSLAAEVLGVRLVEFGRNGTLRWIGHGDPEPPAPRARNVCLQEKGAEFAYLIDPHPTPDQACEWSEQGEDGGFEVDGGLPRPSLLVGVGLTPWPGPAPGGESPCPACGSTRLDPHAYCIRCDSWGRDASWQARRASGQAGPAARARGNASRMTAQQREQQRRAERRKRRRRRRSRLAARGSA